MVWFNVDDTLSNHPKARAAGLEALGLWVVCGSFCGQYLTDGRVPEWYVKSWPNGLKLAKRLVDAELWSVTEGGWIYHQWEERQRTKAQVEADRRAGTARQALFRNSELREAIRQRDGDFCRYCGRSVAWHDRRGAQGGTYDHVTPDGPTDYDNLVVCCRGCNTRKGRRTPQEANMKLRPVLEQELDPTQVPDLVSNKALAIPSPAQPLSTSVSSSPPPSPNASRANGRADENPPHRHEANALRALTALKQDRSLPLTVNELLVHAYRLGHGDPWQGYLAVKVATNFQLDTARNPVLALRARLEATT